MVGDGKIQSGEITHGIVILCFFFYWLERSGQRVGYEPYGGE